jgi:phytoene dehydrogenase-like protein
MCTNYKGEKSCLYFRAENWTVWGLENGLKTLVEELSQHLTNKGVEIFTQYNINNLVFR